MIEAMLIEPDDAHLSHEMESKSPHDEVLAHLLWRLASFVEEETSRISRPNHRGSRRFL